jgi:hypothetical protein
MLAIMAVATRGITGRGVEFGVTQARLDEADIGAAFEQDALQTCDAAHAA